MIIGVPKEVKKDEYRVALLPVGAHLLREDGHAVLIQKDAGLASGFSDQAYADAGAQIVDTADEIYAQAELVVKVKEPQPEEIAKLRVRQIVFCYFHFAASRELTVACLKAGISAVAYETLRDAEGRLPLLSPMSEIAGRMSIQEGAKYLEKPMMGQGILLGGVPGVAPANVLILGGGVVGTNAARMAAGLGANVTIMDINLDRLRYLDEILPANATTIYSDPHTIEDYATSADLVIGAVLIPGDRAPVLIDKKLLTKMKSGSVIVDVCIDQGGCTEASRPTMHSEPTYVVDAVVHYCVTNIPGAVSRTSSPALCNASLPYVRELAGLRLDPFMAENEGYAAAVNMRDNCIANNAVAHAFGDLPRG
ncbi:MAG: alanine dehydrogenase [Planctomycetes bacterium]|nr:alanine dehydrogenase [Planctomycetota bacterium]MBL7154248.1 alanine dehydrogenase [Phycisphaerae bacterium]